MRARIIKPEFWDDEVLARNTTRDTRLLFIGLWNYSDDYGVVKGNSTWIKNKIFPYEEIKIDTVEKWLKELQPRWILPFDNDGVKYYYIKSFTTHQTINRPSKFKNPSPPDTLTEYSLSPQDTLTDEVNRSKEEVNKKEYNALFETFYQAYPIKQAKQNAFKAWSKLQVDDVLIEKMLKAISLQKDSKQWKEGFIPHPATWLNGRRWEDEISVQKKQNEAEFI